MYILYTMRESEFEELYNQGYTDTDISRELKESVHHIRKWRYANGLTANPKRSLVIYEELYTKGMTDGQIAEIVGVHKTSVTNWRERRNLPANGKIGYQHCDVRKNDKLYAKIEKWYFRRLTDEQVARKAHTSASFVADWRIKYGLPPVWDWSNANFMKDPESLYCDGAFLERLLDKHFVSC